MLKITELENNSENLILKLEGRVSGEWADELMRFCNGLDLENRQLILDLADVHFVDDYGIKILQKLKSKQAKFINSSLFVQKLLNSSK